MPPCQPLLAVLTGRVGWGSRTAGSGRDSRTRPQPPGSPWSWAPELWFASCRACSSGPASGQSPVLLGYEAGLLVPCLPPHPTPELLPAVLQAGTYQAQQSMGQLSRGPRRSGFSALEVRTWPTLPGTAVAPPAVVPDPANPQRPCMKEGS